MLERFQTHLQTTGLVPPGTSLLVGYSGGPDSTCLLHLLKSAGRDVVAAHLNHLQRPQAESDVAHCQSFCDNLQIPLVIGKADVPLIARDHKIGLEEAGRQARYTFFQQAAFQTSCPLVATAHTQDDQLETVLFNLTRGTGLKGLSGIPEQRDNIVRPLLPFTRQEVLEYCRTHELPTIHDSSNDNLEFARVRVRKRIVPELESLNPEVRANVARTASLVAEEDSFLDGLAATALEAAEIKLNGPLAFLTHDCELALDPETLGRYPAVIVRRAFRLAVDYLGGSLDHALTQSLLQAVQEDTIASFTAEGGKVAIEFTPGQIHLRNLETVEPFRFPLTVPGETVSDVFGWQLVAESWPPTDYQRDARQTEVVIDASQTKGTLYFRSLESGDKIHPLGLQGTKLLSDLFTDLKLTLAARKRIPIICDMVGPVWVPGVVLAERVKITAGTSKAIRLKLEPLGVAQGS